MKYIDFGKELFNLEHELEESDKVTEVGTHFKTMNDGQEEVKTVAETSPSAVVAMAWEMIEQEIVSTIKRTGISSDHVSHNTALKNMKLLKDKGLIDESVGRIDDIKEQGCSWT